MITTDHQKEEKVRELHSNEFHVKVESGVSVVLNKTLERDFAAVLLDLTDEPILDPVHKLRNVFPAVPLIAIIPHENSRLEISLLQAGVHDCVHPDELSPAILSRKIRNAIERSRFIENQKKVTGLKTDGECEDAEQRVREQADLMRGILQSMSAHIAVLDSSGTIRAVNSAWEDFAKKHGATNPFQYGVGQNYLKVCMEAKGSEAGIAQRIYEGLKKVLNGDLPSFKFEYSITVQDQKLWFVMQATSLSTHPSGAVVSHFDITDQKIAEHEHRRSEHKLSTIFRMIHSAISLVRVSDGKITDFNDGAIELLGYSRDELQNSTADSLNLIVDASDGYRIQQYLVAEGSIKNVEMKIRRKDGRIRTINVSVELVDFYGEQYMLATAYDITERKEHVEALRLAEQTLRKHSHRQKALNQLGQMALAGRLLEEVMNEAVFLVSTILKTDFCEVLELQPDNTRLLLKAGKGFNLIDVGELSVETGFNSQAGYALLSRKPIVVHNMRREKPFKVAPHLQKEDVMSGLTVIIHSTTGPYGTLSVYTKSERDFSSDETGFLQAAANVLAVVIERSRADEMLRESEERYRTLFEESRDAVFICTVDGRILEINQAGVEMFGYSSQAEMQHLQISEDIYLNPEERTAYRKKIDKEGFIQDYEINMKRKDGQILNILETSTVILDEHGRIVGYRGILRDVTNLKHLQQQLMQSQKMETIGQLAGGIAHDFNNIMMAILSYSEIVSLKITDKNPIYQDVAGIQKAAEQGIALTKQMLAFSRKQILQPVVVDLNQAMGNMEQIIRRLIGEDIELITVYSNNLGKIQVDQGQFEQVILNLSVNARDAMPHGGRLIIETLNREFDENQTIPLPEMQPGSYVMVSVTDTGYGINKKILPRIFEPFFTTKEEGTGFGLSTVYGIVKQSGGHISVYSEVGKGTIFKIYFPRHDKQETISSSVEKIAVSQLKGSEMILLVDDNESVRKAVSALLEMNGYKVFQAGNGKEALEKSRSLMERVDLLITDVVMPQMGGRELATLLSAEKPRTKTLFMSGYSEEAVQLHGVLAPETYFLSKPAQMPELLRKVREILDSN
jgi:PAS domain S-box-containing protein